MAAATTGDYERTLLMVREVYVYKIPPRPSSKGYKANDWDLNGWIWQGRLRVVGLGDKCFVWLEDPTTGDLFAMCKYNKSDNSVEQVVDSSRYFVIRIENDRGQHTFIGIGFQERTHAFDFNVTLQDFEKHLNAEKDAAKRIEEWDKLPKKDFSLKDGQTLSIKIGNIGGGGGKATSTTSSSAGDGSSFLLPPPGSAPRLAQPGSTLAAPAPAKWEEFGDFQAPSSSGGSSGSGGGGFSGWTTF